MMGRRVVPVILLVLGFGLRALTQENEGMADDGALVSELVRFAEPATLRVVWGETFQPLDCKMWSSEILSGIMPG